MNQETRFIIHQNFTNGVVSRNPRPKPHLLSASGEGTAGRALDYRWGVWGRGLIPAAADGAMTTSKMTLSITQQNHTQHNLAEQHSA